MWFGEEWRPQGCWWTRKWWSMSCVEYPIDHCASHCWGEVGEDGAGALEMGPWDMKEA